MNKKSSQYPVIEWSINQALTTISTTISPLNREQISVIQALGRITAVPLPASRPKPSYNQSSRDGFALSSQPDSVNGTKATFRIIDEIAAGCGQRPPLQPGEAVRIMTGAMVPDGGVRVVPFEICCDLGQTVEVASEPVDNQPFIRQRGCDVKEGDLLVPAGTRLLPDHLLILAENGWIEFPVHRRPQVAVICTGSELVEVGETIQPGQKISGNGVLLSALLQTQGADCPWSVTADDRVKTIVEQIRNILANVIRPDMIITTGGMGPGKFDLMEQVFAELEGTLLYNRLLIRPGKSTLLGMLDNTPLFALPGPPPAVRLLFHELIVPALNKLQGLENASNKVTATLEGDIRLKQSGHFSLKGGIARLDDGKLVVRPARRMESINAIMYLNSHGAVAEQGTAIKIRLVEPLHGLTI